MPPKLNRKRALFVLTKIDEILAWEKQKEAERDTRFVDLGRYLCETRAGQYWRLENLKSFDEFLAKRFPESSPMIAAYQAAKAALEAVSDSMRIEFSPFGVHVSAIAPGSISTPMLNRSPEQLNRLADALPKSLQPVYADALRAFAKTVASAQRFSTSPAKASLTILRAVTAPRPRTRYLIGTDAKLSAFLKRNLPDRWMDAIIFWMFGLPRRRLPGKRNTRFVGKPEVGNLNS